MPSQYGEDQIIKRFFGKKKGGCMVDVGAADGIDGSNSDYLINNLGWSALLVEPHPGFANHLRVIYRKNKRVKVKEVAIAKSRGQLTMYLAGYWSTLSHDFAKQASSDFGFDYEEETEVECWPLASLLPEVGHPRTIDFLSVDAEGIDIEVLQSMDWDTYNVNLVCCEFNATTREATLKAMEEIGFDVYDETPGNLFFQNPNFVTPWYKRIFN